MWCLNQKHLIVFIICINILNSISAETCVITSFADVEKISSCSKVVLRDLEVPGGETLEINLQDGAELTFDGITKFARGSWNGPLISLKGNGVTVQSSSKEAYLDGQGPLYWDSQGEHNLSNPKPIFFHIEATNSVFKNINLFNCPLHCTDIQNTNDTEFYSWNINNTAGQPGIAANGKEGHNTDGFFIYTSHNVLVADSVIVNQDDCAVIRSGSNITISNLHCTGSHGLSLSAGDSKTSSIENTILNVTFQHSIVINAQNGIHVKTHNDGGAGKISGVTYQNITFSGIENYGIMIQQDYANGSSTGIPKGNIPITGLNMFDVSGTVFGKKSMAVYILCASGACDDWQWSDVNISGNQKKDSCTFVPNGYNC